MLFLLNKPSPNPPDFQISAVELASLALLQASLPVKNDAILDLPSFPSSALAFVSKICWTAEYSGLVCVGFLRAISRSDPIGATGTVGFSMVAGGSRIFLGRGRGGSVVAGVVGRLERDHWGALIESERSKAAI